MGIFFMVSIFYLNIHKNHLPILLRSDFFCTIQPALFCLMNDFLIRSLVVILVFLTLNVIAQSWTISFCFSFCYYHEKAFFSS